MASPLALREVRVKTGSTFRTEHQNAASSDWNAVDGTATKLRVTVYDDSGLVQEGLEDESLQTRMHAKDAPYEGLRGGTIKLAGYLGGAHANVDWSVGAIIANALLGGCVNPTTARSTVVIAGTITTLNIPYDASLANVVAGQAMLLGTRGDGRGGGEVKPIASVTANAAQLDVAAAVAPNAGDAIVFSTTAYLDEDVAQTYIDGLGIGHATADQRQWIGGAGGLSITGLVPGEAPVMETELMVGDHQYVPTGDRTTLSHAVSPQGNDPATERGLGMFQVSDHDSTTRTLVKGGDITFESGVAVEAFPNHAGLNGLGGFQRIPGVPKMEFTLLYDEDMLGLRDDFTGQTAKLIIYQTGTSATQTAAIEFPKAYLAAAPVPAALGNVSGVKIAVHGTEDFVASDNLLSSAVRIHWF